MPSKVVFFPFTDPRPVDPKISAPRRICPSRRGRNAPRPHVHSFATAKSLMPTFGRNRTPVLSVRKKLFQSYSAARPSAPPAVRSLPYESALPVGSHTPARSASFAVRASFRSAMTRASRRMSITAVCCKLTESLTPTSERLVALPAW